MSTEFDVVAEQLAQKDLRISQLQESIILLQREVEVAQEALRAGSENPSGPAAKLLEELEVQRRRAKDAEEAHQRVAQKLKKIQDTIEATGAEKKLAKEAFNERVVAKAAAREAKSTGTPGDPFAPQRERRRASLDACEAQKQEAAVRQEQRNQEKGLKEAESKAARATKEVCTRDEVEYGSQQRLWCRWLLAHTTNLMRVAGTSAGAKAGSSGGRVGGEVAEAGAAFGDGNAGEMCCAREKIAG